MNGAELAKVLRDLASLVEPQARVLGLRIEPAPGVVISVQVADGGKEPKSAPRAEQRVLGRWANSTPEERAEAARRASEARWGRRVDASSDASLTDELTDNSTHRDASDGHGSNGGVMGGSDPDLREKHGKESGSPEKDLTGEDPKNVADASHASSVNLGDASTHRRMTHHDPVDGTAAERAVVKRVFEFWKQDTGHTRALLDRKRGRRILARLREGFTPERLITAITNRRNDDWLMGRGDSPRVFDELETLLRDAAQVERLERLTAPAAPRPAAVNGQRNVASKLVERARALAAQNSAPVLESTGEPA